VPGNRSEATAERIVSVAMDMMAAVGIKQTNLEEVARRAGVSHMTLYRRWPRKADLVNAVIQREVQGVFAAADERIKAFDNPVAKFVEGFAAILLGVRENRLLKRELALDREQVLIALSDEAAFDLAVTYLADRITNIGDHPGLPPIADPEALAEIYVRIAQSLVFTPPTRFPLNTEADLRAYAHDYLLPLAAGRVTQPQNQ
jgi:AcrR family transcriptional regulator